MYLRLIATTIYIFFLNNVVHNGIAIIIHIFNYSTKLRAFCKISNKKFIVLMFKFYVGVFPTRITLFPHSSTNFIIFAL